MRIKKRKDEIDVFEDGMKGSRDYEVKAVVVRDVERIYVCRYRLSCNNDEITV